MKVPSKKLLALLAVLIGRVLRAEETVPDLKALPQRPISEVEIIHAIKYPLRYKHLFGLEGAGFFGDKFVNSYGMGPFHHFYLNEKVGIRTSLIILNNTLTGEVDDLKKRGIRPTVYNPATLLKSGILWQPIYGKMVIGESIQRFYVGVEAGAYLARQELLATENENLTIGSKKLTAGPFLGLQGTFLFHDHLALHAGVDVYAGASEFNDHKTGLRVSYSNNLGLSYRF